MSDDLVRKLRGFLVNPHGPEAADRIEDLERERAVWQEHFDHMAMQIAELERELAEAKETIAQMEDVMDGAGEMLRGEDN